jgi:acetyl-CoA synthetase
VGTTAGAQFLRARDHLLHLRDDLTSAQRDFHWPQLEQFNWVGDYFDVIAQGNDSPALRLVDDAGGDVTLSFSQLSDRSAQVASFLASQGLTRGDRLLLMLPNCIPLWETMLAAIRLGLVVIPATILLDQHELRDRIERGQVKAVITDLNLTPRFTGIHGVPIRIAVGEPTPGWIPYANSTTGPQWPGAAPTSAADLLFLYFTSGTSAQPKLVAHTHVSYPVGHLSTLYWLGLKPGDVHLNLSSPGWAKHAWSSFFAPWNAQATILAYHYDRFDARALLNVLVRCNVTTFCAPPTVWRLLIQHDLRAWPVRLREVTSAGEPLNPEVISQVRDAWGLTLRDGFGQTETTAQVGNPPNQLVKAGSMGRPLPGFPIVLLNTEGQPAEEGEICIDLARRPLGLMSGYHGDPERTASTMADGYYHTGDVASRDADGYLTYIGRVDDVFKSSDYRISPDPMRLSVPKAFITLTDGHTPDARTAASILAHVRNRVSPFKRIRRLEFAPLPKTISGKIRRAELRRGEQLRPLGEPRHPTEFWEEDLPTCQP